MLKEKFGDSIRFFSFVVIIIVCSMYIACAPTRVPPPEAPNGVFTAVEEEDIASELPEELLRKSEEVLRRRFARFNFVYFESKVLKPYEEQGIAEPFTIDLFEDVGIKVSTISVEKKDGDMYVWKGRPEAKFYGRALLSFNKYTTFGVIQVDSMVYEIMPVRDNIVVITEMDQRKYPEEAPPIIPRKEQGKEPYKPKDTERDEPTRSNIRALVVLPIPSYSIFCDGRFPFFDNILDLLAAIFQENLNDVFNAVIPAGVTATVDFVCYRFDPEGGDLVNDLDRLRTDSGIASLRDEHRADLVSLIVPSGDFCGRGYENYPVEAADEAFAFTVVKASCALGNYSMAHEMGHNMGMRHDRAADDAFASSTCNYGHIFPVEISFFGLSFKFKARTVMAYGSSCGDCPRMGVYSTPTTIDIGTVKIGPMGVSCETAPSGGNYTRANNRQQLIDAAPTVSNFR
jgi:hypothetical protein